MFLNIFFKLNENIHHRLPAIQDFRLVGMAHKCGSVPTPFLHSPLDLKCPERKKWLGSWLSSVWREDQSRRGNRLSLLNFLAPVSQAGWSEITRHSWQRIQLLSLATSRGCQCEIRALHPCKKTALERSPHVWLTASPKGPCFHFTVSRAWRETCSSAQLLFLSHLAARDV